MIVPGQTVSWLALGASLAMATQMGLPQGRTDDPERISTAPPPRSSPTPSPSPVPDTPAIDPDAPIVPDAEFEGAMPSLSSDINAPLEPLPSQAAPAAAAQMPPPPVTGPPPETQAIQPGTLPPPAEPAPELAQPLVPLGQFGSTPPAAVADVRDGSSVEIRYDTVVRGLDEVGLTGQFNALSALRGGHGRAANAAMIAARGREDEALAGRLMRSLGYYDGTAVSLIEQPSGQPGSEGGVRAIVSATPGHRYALSSVAVEAPAVMPADLITHNLPLRVGDPIEAARVQGAEANVSLVLPQQGYPFVSVGQRDILLDDGSFTGAYTLPVDPGPRASFGTYTTDGRLAFDAHHVGVLARFHEGELYDNRRVDDLRQALVATSLFSTVTVEPVRTGRPGPDGTEVVDLRVHQEAGPPRTLAASAGYGTGQGIRVEGTFTHRNLFPPEGALIVSGIGGTQEQGLGVTFRRSNAGQRDRSFSLIASANHSDYDAYSAFTGTLAARISYDSTPIWQKRITYAFGVELTGTNESVYDFSRMDRVRGTYFIAALPGQVQFDTSDDLLNPTRGYRLKLSISPETSVRGGVSPYVRTLAEASAYFPIGGSIVLAGRVRAGSIAGIARDDLAPSRRYYGGGGGSVRGYGYQELGPRDPNNDPVGGRSLNEAAFEVRYRFGNFGIVPFVDVGQAYAGTFPTGQDLQFGAGIGGRFYTNFGPFRLDLATPLNRRRGDPRLALYISIGQAF